MATEDKNSIVYEIDGESVYFGESKRSNKEDRSKNAIVKRMKLLNTVGKKITTLTGIKRKLLIGK